MRLPISFSSPFIEERLYFALSQSMMNPGLSFSSPFIEERLYFNKKGGHLWVLIILKFSSPFIEERLYFNIGSGRIYHYDTEFSSPFIEERLYLNYLAQYTTGAMRFSSPFIEERLYFTRKKEDIKKLDMFSSPFIEERLYLGQLVATDNLIYYVLVPFYRGAVVFKQKEESQWKTQLWFSSPFIEERLYLNKKKEKLLWQKLFSSPFIEERLYFVLQFCLRFRHQCVLVPFYRGAVVFKCQPANILATRSSRPLLSRSGCILKNILID